MSAERRPRMKYMGPAAQVSVVGDGCADSIWRRTATSPVLNQDPFPSGSGTNSSRVAFSLRQYSLNIVGPLNWISPSRSLPSGVSSSPGWITVLVSVSTRRTCTLGRGYPTEPSTRVEGDRAQESAMPTSVMP